MKKIRFNKKKHTYHIGKKKLISVTQLLDTLFEPFDAKEIARRLAKFPKNKKEKKGVRYWLNEWKEAASHGTRVHNLLEKYVKKGYFDTELATEFRDKAKFAQGIKFYHNEIKKEKPELLKAEMQIGSEKLGVAGTIDLVIGFDGVIYLIDWKTNNKFTTTGYKGKTGTHELTKDIQDCKLNRYQLQLSIYAYILETEYDYIIGGLKIPHLEEDKYTVYEVDYQKELVEKILEDFKIGKEKTKLETKV